MEARPQRRTISVFVGAGFAVLIGLVGLMSGQVGIRGRGSEADNSLALLNLLTGVCSLAGGIGYILLKRWSIPVFGLSVAGHCVSHGVLFASRFSTEPDMIFRSAQLAVVPVISLVILITMMRQCKRGLLSR